MTVIDLPRPALDADEPATIPVSWHDDARRPPSQYWCLWCASWHDRRDLGPDSPAA